RGGPCRPGAWPRFRRRPSPVAPCRFPGGVPVDEHAPASACPWPRGERLPLAKDLAVVLGVNKNTVLRALHILRDEGLLEFRRGRGITVAGTPQRGAVLARTRDLLDFARHHGFGREEIIQIIETLP